MVFVPSLRLAPLLRRELHDPDLVGVLALYDPRHAALVHDEDAVAHAEHLREFG